MSRIRAQNRKISDETRLTGIFHCQVLFSRSGFLAGIVLGSAD